MAMEPTAPLWPQSLDPLAGFNTTLQDLTPLLLALNHALDAALTTSPITTLVQFANSNFTYLVLEVIKVFQAMALPFPLRDMLVPPPTPLPTFPLTTAPLTITVAQHTSAVQQAPLVILLALLTMVPMPAQ